jgi:transposase InsO family protein
MSHRNARLTPRGRLLLVQRVRIDGMPVAHVASAMGVSRQCAHRWVKRFDQEGVVGLEDRSSRPLHVPHATDAKTVALVLKKRRELRCGPAILAAELKIPERTISRILKRHGVPRIAECDPITGEVIRASRETTVRYERSRPGELVHVDVKKLGRIPPGGGWRTRGRIPETHHHLHNAGYDFIHSMIDDHSRLAYSEVLSDERGPTCAGFVVRAAEAFRTFGIERIEAVMTDNAFNYRRSADFQRVLLELGARHLLIRPHCPWQNGKAERLNRTLQIEWAYRRAYTSNSQRTRALARWLRHYNNVRPHSALGGRSPVSRLSST